jgi:NADH:ubiquinone oxidoreductase subunit 2 (subunit N)
LPGFFGKLFVFKSVIASGHTLWATVAFVGSFLGLAYYVGIALRLFRPGPTPEPVPAHELRTRRHDETVA